MPFEIKAVCAIISRKSGLSHDDVLLARLRVRISRRAQRALPEHLVAIRQHPYALIKCNRYTLRNAGSEEEEKREREREIEILPRNRRVATGA